MPHTFVVFDYLCPFLGRHTGEYRDAAVVSYRATVLKNGTLTIIGASDDDEGHYLCEANNGIGTGLSKVIMLQVHGKMTVLENKHTAFEPFHKFD